MNEVFAWQIDPAEQDSMIDDYDCYWSEVAAFGNKQFNNRTFPEFDIVVKNLEDVASDYAESDRPADGGLEVYLFMLVESRMPKADGHPYTDAEIKRWKEIMLHPFPGDYWAICKALSLVTGKEYTQTQITGSSQSDWQNIFYPADWTQGQVNELETLYFNTGTEWRVEFQENGVVTEQDEYCYCTEYSNDGIRMQLSDFTGVDPEYISLYRFDGYDMTPRYKVVEEAAVC